MRRLLGPIAGLLVLLSLACALPGADEAVVAEVPAAPTLWALTQDGPATLVKAGTTEGLAIDTVVVLLGPPLAGTQNRQVVGSARVAEIWPDLARVTPERLRTDTAAPESARLPLPEDAVVLDTMPTVATSPPPTARAARQAQTTPDAALVLPSDLTGGTPDARIDALVRYEPDPDATAVIVWVMKNDGSADVRAKAWRVVRARWKRGTGSAADHEAAAIWLAANGTTDLRIEALGAMGDRSTSVRTPGRQLADDNDDIRVAAARAVHDIGMRTSKHADARKALEDRRDVESSASVRKKLAEWIAEL